MQQIARKMNKPIFTLFVDLSAAFDHVERRWMFKSIYQRLSPTSNLKLFNLLESIYAYTSTSLTKNENDIFEVTLGVRQGGPESPTLYNLSWIM